MSVYVCKLPCVASERCLYALFFIEVGKHQYKSLCFIIMR
jgi:hypothetical protein